MTLASVLAIGCCTEYQQTPGDGCERDTGAHDSTPVAPEELCDGLDNDSDGYSDEGFPDQDADWIADCLDDACTVDPSGAEPVEGTHACSVEVVPSRDPWNVELLWEAWQGHGEYGCQGGAVVVDVDGDEISDVLCTGSTTAVAYSGLDGAVIWTRDHMHFCSPFAAGDSDLDGDWEIYAVADDNKVLRLDTEGAVAWRSTSTVIPDPIPSFWDTYDGFAPLDLVDLVGDGVPAVVGASGAWSAGDGGTRFALERPFYNDFFPPPLAVADLDRAGVGEIVTAWWVFSATGWLLWSVPVPPLELTPLSYPETLLVQADDDAQAEIVLIESHGFTVLEHDGTPRVEVVIDPVTWSRSCAGDVDGDGRMEIPLSGKDTLQLFELDGTLAWTRRMSDWTQGVGCTTFDFDLDGAAEIVIPDEENLYILDGRSGAALFVAPNRNGGTIFENPLVVDLDGDGSAEIVDLVAAGTFLGDAAIRVYGNVNRDWPPGGRIWPSATWSGTSLFPDGSVPRTPEAPWLTTLRWRGQPEVLLGGLDLRPEVVGSCVSSCDPTVGTVLLDLRLANPGPQEIQRGSSIAAYAQVEDGSRTPVGVLDFPDFVDNGWASSSQSLSLSLDQAMAGLVLVAGDDGSGGLDPLECAPDDNELTWRLDACD